MPVTRKRTTTTTTAGNARRRYVARSSTRASRATAYANTRLGWSMANPEQPLPGPRRSYQRPELKYFDTVLASTWDGSNGPSTVTIVNKPPQGAGSTNRIGNAISLRSLEVVGEIFAGTAQVTNQCCRMIICWDHQPDSAGIPTPITPQLLINATPDGLFNVNNTDRYTILYDKIFYVSASAANPNWMKPIHLYLSLKNVEARYPLAPGNFPVSNSLCIYTMGDTAVGVNTNPTWIAQSRIRFIDA
ncbi:MAG: capsid protein [Cressdnaviricota sp.]|nr:MAG: capsid protein [Cressdnaviricota sp.]